MIYSCTHMATVGVKGLKGTTAPIKIRPWPSTCVVVLCRWEAV